MRANPLNYIAAALFFAAAIRDWFFPGVLQIARHPAALEEGIVWVVMSGTCMAVALAHSRRSPSERQL